MAAHLHTSGGRSNEAARDLGQRRLAGAVGTQQANQLPVANLQADPAEGSGIAVSLQAVAGDDRHALSLRSRGFDLREERRQLLYGLAPAVVAERLDLPSLDTKRGEHAVTGLRHVGGQQQGRDSKPLDEVVEDLIEALGRSEEHTSA